jgi:hypothetical protein
MKEYKSKKTGRVSLYTDEEHEEMVATGLASKFIVTDLRSRPIIPFMKEVPTEVKVIKKKKNEG